MHNQSSIESKVFEVMKTFTVGWTQSHALTGSLQQQWQFHQDPIVPAVWAGWGALLHYLSLSGRFYWKAALSAQSIRRYLGRLWCKMDRRPHPAFLPASCRQCHHMESNSEQPRKQDKVKWVKKPNYSEDPTAWDHFKLISQNSPSHSEMELLVESSGIRPEAKHKSNKNCSKLLHIPSHRPTIWVNLIFPHADSKSSGKLWWWGLLEKYTIKILRKTRNQIWEAFHFCRFNKVKSCLGLNNLCNLCTTV